MLPSSLRLAPSLLFHACFVPACMFFALRAVLVLCCFSGGTQQPWMYFFFSHPPVGTMPPFCSHDFTTYELVHPCCTSEVEPFDTAACPRRTPVFIQRTASRGLTVRCNCHFPFRFRTGTTKRRNPSNLCICMLTASVCAVRIGAGHTHTRAPREFNVNVPIVLEALLLCVCGPTPAVESDRGFGSKETSL